MAKRIISLDCDGCIFNTHYRPHRELIKSNKRFLNRLKIENEQYDDVTVFVGSNRQSFGRDCFNSNKNKTESAFTAIAEIANYLGAKLDKFLLADLETDSVPGTSFDAAIMSEGNEPYEDHRQWLFDEDKLALLYAQMHKSASEDESETVFDFYDDRGLIDGVPTDILEKLRDYFLKYPMMIPHNTTLRLNHYSGGKVTSVASIKGTGPIDNDYYNTLHRMSQVAEQYEPLSLEKHLTRYITPKNIKKIEPEPEIKHQRFGTLHNIFHMELRKKQPNKTTKSHANSKNRMPVS